MSSSNRDGTQQHFWAPTDLVNDIDDRVQTSERYDNRKEFWVDAAREKLNATNPSEIREELERLEDKEEQWRNRLEEVKEKKQQYQQRLGEVQQREEDYEEVVIGWAEDRLEHPRDLTQVFEPENPKIQKFADRYNRTVGEVIDDICANWDVDEVEDIPHRKTEPGPFSHGGDE